MRRDDQEREQRAWLVERLNQVTRGLTADLDLGAVLRRIVESAAELVEADIAGFVMVDADGAVLSAVHGLPDELLGHRYPPDDGAIWEAIDTGAPVVVDDYGEYRRRRRGLDPAIASVQSAVVMPTLIRNHVAGVLSVGFAHRHRAVTPAEIDVLGLLAAHAGAALDNAAAFAEVVRRRAHEQAVIDALADGVAVVNGAGSVTSWNRAAAGMTGISAEEAIGQPVPFEFPIGHTPTEHRLADDRWVEMVATPLGDSGDRVLTLRDISGQKALEEAKSLFLATTSHELKTPLTVISGFAATLQHRWHLLDDEQRGSAIDAIARRSEILLRMIERLLISSQVDVGSLRVLTEPVELAPAMREAAAGLDAVSDHRVVVAPPVEPVTVVADPRAFEQVLGQLLDNAFKYSNPDTVVRLEAVAEDGHAVVRVIDEGVGIAAADLAHVFERFYQGDGIRRATTGGVGLGLFIVRRLVEAQGGTVRAMARDDRPGTVVEFTLPLRDSVSD
ncbi:MAG: two-component system, NtrC family, sensor histidine kinase KinB [Acidimicrobiaceae bacterium]|jgi:signal transduction histidine kinase|nr:two-component system, NtrC family, sensor histidine kinase KinB [Acidimicrobiaceae bacterium]